MVKDTIETHKGLNDPEITQEKLIRLRDQLYKSVSSNSSTRGRILLQINSCLYRNREGNIKEDSDGLAVTQL